MCCTLCEIWGIARKAEYQGAWGDGKAAFACGSCYQSGFAWGRGAPTWLSESNNAVAIHFSHA